MINLPKGQKFTTESFIRFATDLFGDAYDYSEVQYVNNRTKIKIKCNTCGNVFEQRPDSHLRGTRCPCCSRNDRHLTTEEFVNRAKAVHGDRYDYSLTKYVSDRVKVEVMCPQHGSFWQLPSNHLAGNRCPACADASRIAKLTSNTHAFIAKALSVHGDRYDYSLVDYKTAMDPVKIICKVHGVFEQRPHDHLRGHGCRQCFLDDHRLSTSDFVQKARLVHGDSYDYSLVNYQSSDDYVDIVCKKHGVFSQLARTHLSGHGCPLCGIESQADSLRFSFFEFLEMAHAAHGNKYDYSCVDYVDMGTDVKILCPEHGLFIQKPRSHVLGRGCPTCSGYRLANFEEYYTDEFIRRSRAVHGDRYDYSLSQYVTSAQPVWIICKKHGVFSQSPSSHMNGHGCPKCGDESHANAWRLSFDEFVEKARLVHGDKYDYPDSDYVNNNTKIKIWCPKHGFFMQRPRVHLSGTGCPSCGVEQSFETRRKNGTMNTSKPEDDAYDLLVDVFGRDCIERQYVSDVYPFHCDFHVESEVVSCYIEMNLHWTHGGHYFDSSDTADIEELCRWRRAYENGSEYYGSAINTWTQRDLLKRDTAIEQRLNYLVFWDNDLKDFKEWLVQYCVD